MIIESPGIYKGLPNDVYHRSKGISSSGISLILDCPKKFWYQYLSGEVVRESTRAMIIGQVLHTLTLEPETFEERFYVMPEADRRTKIGKEIYQSALFEAGSKTIIDAEDYVTAESMAKNIRNLPMFQKIFGAGNIEDSLMWRDEETGALLRSRPDYYNDFLIVDLKTTEDASRKAFASSIAEYGYHRQGAMACDALTALTGNEYDSVVQFVVEKKAPYLVAAYSLSPETIEQGRIEYKRGAKLYKECIDKNEWPGYEEIIQDIDLPRWAFKQDEVRA